MRTHLRTQSHTNYLEIKALLPSRRKGGVTGAAEINPTRKRNILHAYNISLLMLPCFSSPLSLPAYTFHCTYVLGYSKASQITVFLALRKGKQNVNITRGYIYIEFDLKSCVYTCNL